MQGPPHLRVRALAAACAHAQLALAGHDAGLLVAACGEARRAQHLEDTQRELHKGLQQEGGQGNEMLEAWAPESPSMQFTAAVWGSSATRCPPQTSLAWPPLLLLGMDCCRTHAAPSGPQLACSSMPVRQADR